MTEEHSNQLMNDRIMLFILPETVRLYSEKDILFKANVPLFC